MPVYIYKCRNCSNEFEQKGRYTDSPECSCPKCKGQAKRILSPALVIYKGSGFYVTDHK